MDWGLSQFGHHARHGRNENGTVPFPLWPILGCRRSQRLVGLPRRCKTFARQLPAGGGKSKEYPFQRRTAGVARHARAALAATGNRKAGRLEMPLRN